MEHIDSLPGTKIQLPEDPPILPPILPGLPVLYTRNEEGELLTGGYSDSAKFTLQKPTEWNCLVHGIITATFCISRLDSKWDKLYEHHYCLDCYDEFLQRHLTILKRVEDVR